MRSQRIFFKCLPLLGMVVPLALAPQASQAEGNIGAVERVQGDASVVHAGASAKASQGMTFLLTDHLITGPGGRLQITLTDDTEITLGENAEAVISDYEFTPGRRGWRWSR